jgi:hypothetical protein
MIKTVDPAGFGFDGPIAQRVKVSSRGLRGDDLAAFIKRAGVEFVADLEGLRPGEVPVHWLAVGAYETFGANRNADAFDAHTCRTQHNTFCKYGHYFRSHDNKNPAKSYGRIIKSAFHEPMQRIELLIGLNGTEEAARANGGLLARDEIEKLAAGKDLDGSMACIVNHDVCSHCLNKAASKQEYCDVKPVHLPGGRVVPACSGFGCKDGLTKVAADGRMQFVYNPNARFFDFSGVVRKADRIASSMGLLKAASVSDDSRLALTVPEELLLADRAWSSTARAQVKLANTLAELERDTARYAPYDMGLRTGPIVLFPDAPPATIFRALADEQIVLDAGDWLTVCQGKEAAAAAAEVEAALPGVFTRLVHGDVAALADNPYAPAAQRPPSKVAAWSAQLAAAHSLHREDVAQRCVRSALHAVPSPRIKQAATESPGAAALAQEWAKYAVAALAATTDPNAQRTAAALLVRRCELG